MKYMQTIAKQMAHLGPDLLLSSLESLRAEMVWVWHFVSAFWELLHSHAPQSAVATSGGSRLPRARYLLIGARSWFRPISNWD